MAELGAPPVLPRGPPLPSAGAGESHTDGAMLPVGPSCPRLALASTGLGAPKRPTPPPPPEGSWGHGSSAPSGLGEWRISCEGPAAGPPLAPGPLEAVPAASLDARALRVRGTTRPCFPVQAHWKIWPDANCVGWMLSQKSFLRGPRGGAQKGEQGAQGLKRPHGNGSDGIGDGLELCLCLHRLV